MWVTWGAGRISKELIGRVSTANDHRARAAAARVIRFNIDRIDDAAQRMMKLASDPHGRVRMEVLVGASWLPQSDGLAVLAEIEKQEKDPWIAESLTWAKASLKAEDAALLSSKEQVPVPKYLKKKDHDLFRLGHEVFHRDAHCATCHQVHGKGLDPIYPPLKGSEWVTGNQDRLIKLVMQGVSGPMTVGDKHFGEKTPPMFGFKSLITSDQEMAAVLTYVRNEWGNRADVVSAKKVAEIRKKLESRSEAWTAEELLQMHPMQKGE